MQPNSTKLVALEQREGVWVLVSSNSTFQSPTHGIVLCQGAFDVVHPGHLEHLTQAKAMGDCLIVGITDDTHINKGPGRPVFKQEQRAAHLAALSMVDYVCIIPDTSALPAIQAIRPAVYCKGPDYRDRKDGNFALEKAAVESYGGRVAFTNGFTSSSSALINEYVSPDAQHPIVRRIREQHGYKGVAGWLDKCATLRVLVVGEPIVDEYVYVTPAGKSAKENLITYRRGGVESYPGGGAIISAHVGQVCHDVSHFDGGMSEITKRRYIEPAFNQKVFALVEPFNDRRDKPLPNDTEREQFDLMIVGDFGHGLIADSKDANVLARAYGPKKPYVALTCQSNSLNWGFNTLTKWHKADFVVVDEEELRLACGQRNWGGHDMKWWIVHEYRRLGCKAICVTLGHKGGLLYAGGNTWVEAPALAERIVDRMGAGDAFLSYAAPLACVGAPPDIIALVGSIASAIKVGMRGNQPVQKRTVNKWLKAMLA